MYTAFKNRWAVVSFIAAAFLAVLFSWTLARAANSTTAICVRPGGLMYAIGDGFKLTECKRNDQLLNLGIGGAHGEPDVNGAVGPQGPAGPQGEQGPAGEDGAPGVAGEIGPQGPQGLQGLTGETGPQGSQGLTGETGPRGPQGLQGLTGETGPQGPQGPSGSFGATGLYIRSSEYVAIPGRTYSSGIIAACDPGDLLLNGGYMSPDFWLHVYVNNPSPFSASPSWVVYAYNEGSLTGSLKATASCLDRTP